MISQPSHNLGIRVISACTLFLSTITLAVIPVQASTDSGKPLFLPVVTYEAGGTGSSLPFDEHRVAIIDVNGDGVLDLVAANWCNSRTDCSHGSVGVLLGNGDGTFQPAVTYSSGGPHAFAVLGADVNGDHKPDLVVANGCTPLSNICTGPGSVGILIGNGDGTFQAVRNGLTGESISAIAVADLNRDGRSDVIVAGCGVIEGICWNTEGMVSVLLGKADGTVAAAARYDSGGKVAGTVTIADVNMDGRADVLIGNVAACNTNDNCGTGSVGVLLGNGDGTLRPAVTFSSLWPYSVVVGDLNGDGKPDLMTVTTNGGGDVSVLLGNGDGTFQTMVPYFLGAQYESPAILADINGDRKPDILVGSLYCWNGVAIGRGCLSVLAGNGDGTFQDVVTYSTGAPVGGWLAVADIDGDDKLDMIAANICSNPCLNSPGSVGVLLGNGDGTFQPAITFSSGAANSRWVGVADLNRDGRPDLVVSNPEDYNNFKLGVLLNNAAGLPATTTALRSSLNPSFVGQAVTFTATVSSSQGIPPNGETITFTNGSSVLGTAALSGGVASLTTSSLAPGSFTITATYPGDGSFVGSSSPGLRQVVNATAKSATSTTLASSLNPSTYGQKIAFSARVTTSGPVPPIGTVVFMWKYFTQMYTIGTATLNSAGVATLTKSNLNADLYPMIAVYRGDTNNLASTSVVLNQAVLQTTTKATLTSTPNPSTVGQTVTFTVRISSPTVIATGPVTLTLGATTLGTAQLSGGQATFTTSSLPAGSNVVKVTYNGNSNIARSSAAVTQVVQP